MLDNIICDVARRYKNPNVQFSLFSHAVTRTRSSDRIAGFQSECPSSVVFCDSLFDDLRVKVAAVSGACLPSTVTSQGRFNRGCGSLWHNWWRTELDIAGLWWDCEECHGVRGQLSGTVLWWRHGYFEPRPLLFLACRQCLSLRATAFWRLHFEYFNESQSPVHWMHATSIR